VGYARRWGFASLDVVNLFAYRARDPRALVRAADPVGPDNDRHLRAAIRSADLVVCAWGAARVATQRTARLAGLLAGSPLRCFGRTTAGAPRHPLYLRRDARLVRFSGS
jgi:hypothetical protein